MEEPIAPSEMVLILDRRTLISRVKHQFHNSVPALAEAWPEGERPHRSTINRWIKQNRLPRSAHQLLQLAALLDVDPIGLLRPVAPLPSLLARLIDTSRLASWTGLHPALSFLQGFIGPTRDWPPGDVAENYFGRDWVTHEFDHIAAPHRRNYFAAVFVEPDSRRDMPLDQIWHFAWRDRVDGAAWRPYGFVRASETNVQLISFNGVTGMAAFKEDDVPSFFVETWFGEGGAVFRVASLHRFRLRVVDVVDSSRPVVRFGFP